MLSFNHQAFDKTVEILNEHNISAEKWRPGWYWTNEKFTPALVHVFDFAAKSYEVMAKENNNGYIRFTIDLKL